MHSWILKVACSLLLLSVFGCAIDNSSTAIDSSNVPLAGLQESISAPPASTPTTPSSAGGGSGGSTGNGATTTSGGSNTPSTPACTTTICFGAFSIYDGGSNSTSGNGDNVPNKNETIRMDISVKNTGASDILGASGTLSTASNLVTIDPANATKSYGKLKGTTCPGYSSAVDNPAYGCYTLATDPLTPNSTSAFRITIPVTTPDGSVIPFVLTITDNSGNISTMSFNMTVAALGASISFGAFSIYDGGSNSTSGNGDNVANKNETVRMDISVKNTGASDILGASGTLSTASNLVTIDPANATKSYGKLKGTTCPGYSSAVDNPAYGCYTLATDPLTPNSTSAFRITIPVTTPDGSVIPFVLTITDNSGNISTMSFNMTVTALDVAISFGAFAIYDAGSFSTSGNGDNVVNKNETIRMDISVSNTGASDILGASGTLSTASNLVTIDPANATKSYGTISGGGYYQSALNHSQYSYPTALSPASINAFRMTISNSAPDYSIIPLTLTITDNTGNSWPVNFNMTVYPSGAVVFSSYIIYDSTNGAPYNTDGNGNSDWNPGETIRLNIGLLNTKATSQTVTSATLSSSSGAVTILNQETGGYPVIGGGAVQYVNGNSTALSATVWRLSLANGTPSGTVIPFSIVLNGGTWQDTFTYVVP